MYYRLIYFPKVREDIRHLSPETKRFSQSALDEISTNPRVGAPLSDELAGLWKYRAKRYRIIYRVDSGRREILIYLVDERESVYDKLLTMLGLSKGLR